MGELREHFLRVRRRTPREDEYTSLLRSDREMP